MNDGGSECLAWRLGYLSPGSVLHYRWFGIDFGSIQAETRFPSLV